MPRKCCVPECKGNYTIGPKVSVFSFPQQEELKNKWLKSICRDNFVPTKQSLNFTRALNTKPEKKFWLRIREKIGLLQFSDATLNHGSSVIYGCCTDPIDHLSFFKRFSMEDSYFSWFLITELHVWMSMVRVMDEDKEGRQSRNFIVKHMWNDCDKRMEALGPIKSSIKRSNLQEMHAHFVHATYSYDEGLLSNDRVLASALWQMFFQNNCDDPEKIEVLISYIRRSVDHLDSLDGTDLLLGKPFTWPPMLEVKQLQ